MLCQNLYGTKFQLLELQTQRLNEGERRGLQGMLAFAGVNNKG